MGANWRRFLVSKRAWLWLTPGVALALILFVTFIHRFLAVSEPIGKGVLVAEAWIPEKNLAESATLFNSGRYQYFVVVGGPVQGSDSKPDDPAGYPGLATRRLAKLGFDTTKIIKLSASPESSVFGRTLASATAVKRWLSDSRVSVCCVDVFTVGVHARKSWILSRYVLGDGYRVGIISGSPQSYDPKSWLASRSGIRTVFRNVAGYVYSKFWILFHRIASAGDTSFPAEADRFDGTLPYPS